MKKSIRLNERDQVATVLEEVKGGEVIEVTTSNLEKICKIEVLQNISFGNKVALQDIPCEATLYKGGYPVGRVIKDISKGDIVHVQNVRSTHIDIPQSIIDEIIKQMGIKEDR